ncbi:hypothetical protein [Bartonella sp. DGB1]|uniref:hypothetical protein n=1 Tax=Bartonella sp. DGB1 TaxID=3239807 RepID=UPI0035268D94
MKNSKIFFRTTIELIKSSPKLAILLLLLTIFAGFFPLITIYSISMMISAFEANNISDVVLYAIVWVFSLSFPHFLANIIMLLQSAMAENMLLYFTLKISTAINNIKYLNIFEDEEIYKDIDVIKDNISNRPVNFIVTLGLIITSVVSIISISLSIIHISIYLPLLSLGLGAIIFFVSARSQQKLWSGTLTRNFQSRMMKYIFSLSVDKTAMQEIRIYHFSDFLKQKFIQMHNEVKKIMYKVRWEISFLSFISAISIILISLAMIYNVFYLISVGVIGLASLVFLLQAIQRVFKLPPNQHLNI